MRILVIGAHPDDEIFGLGGTLLKHKLNGDDLFIHILSDGDSSRRNKSFGDKNKNKFVKNRIIAAKKIFKDLKVKDYLLDEYDDQKLDAYPIVQIIKSIEAFAKKVKPDIVYTHFENDLNEDHRVVFRASMVAFRPIENRPKRIFSYQIPSSTEWGCAGFNPNYFVNISKQLNRKLELLKTYDFELRKYPHPRSIQKIVHSAEHWGGVINVKAAEAFLLLREIWE